MVDIQDFFDAIPQIQTAASFGFGFAIGALTRLYDKRQWMPAGSAAFGALIAAENQGTISNYGIDVGSAVVGDYLGSKLVENIRKYLSGRTEKTDKF